MAICHHALPRWSLWTNAPEMTHIHIDTEVSRAGMPCSTFYWRDEKSTIARVTNGDPWRKCLTVDARLILERGRADAFTGRSNMEHRTQ